MKLQMLAAACAALVSLSAGAAHAESAVTAKLAQPVAAKTKIVAGGAVWICDGATCVANSPGSRTFALATCKDLAKELGAIAAFSDTRKDMPGERLEQCNASAAAQTQVAKR